MNKPSSLSADLSASMLAPSDLQKMKENQQFCEQLLAYAKWLDSQSARFYVFDYNRSINIVNSPDFNRRLKPETIIQVFGFEVDNEHTFYDNYTGKVTNSERVLAVLLLRSAILAGDSFV